MDLQPLDVSLDNDRLSFFIPFMKVDQKERTVQGFATLDNIDNADDIVDSNASMEAFKAWPGNLREMHQKVAVGRALTASPRQYTDDEGNTYNGIWVKARVSQGAEDTWQKVLDGTLTGFSVGGAIQETKRELLKGKPVRRVTKYRLNELSLVDAPCNGLATFSLIKDIDGESEFTDIVEKVSFDAATPISKFLPKKVRQRESVAGKALGPIQTQDHVDYAAHLVNDAKNPESLRAHIIHSTNSLGLRLPAGWDNSESIKDMKKFTDEPLIKDADGDDDASSMDECKGCDNETDHINAAQAHLREAASKAGARNDHSAAADLHNHAADLDYAKQKAMLAHVKDMGKSIEDMSLEDLEKAVLTSKARNALPKSAFAYVDENGKGHFPIHDAAHVRNALARLNQSPFGPKAKPAVMAAAKKFGIETDDDGGDTSKSNDVSTEKEIDAKNEDENLLQKFLAIVKGSELSKSQDDTKSKEDMESEMDSEEFAKALEGFGADLNKTLKKKLSSMSEELEKSNATSEAALAELKDELTKKIEELSNRMDGIESSGAIKKSGEGDGAEKLEKSDEGDAGLWADAIVPSMIKERFSGLR